MRSNKLEPTIWSCDTGQQIPCFDRCQLIITWMSNTKEVHSKPRLHVSLSACYLEYGSHLARLHRRRRPRRRHRRRRAYAPTINTASHDNHEKINLWVFFCFQYMGCLWSSATSYDVSQATTYPTTSKSFLFYLLFFLHLRIKYSVSLESLNTVELPVSNQPKCQALEVPYERWSSTRA